MTTANKLMIAFAIVMLSLTGLNCYVAYASITQNNIAALERDLIIKQNDVIINSSKALMDGDVAMMGRVEQLARDQTAILSVQKNIADFITKGY